AGIDVLGALSARQAYDLVLPMARGWASDVELQSVGAGQQISIPDVIGAVGSSSITEEGRLRPQSNWRVRFVSKRLDRYCWFVVPHTGRVWWDFYPVMQGTIPKYSPPVLDSNDWIDSTEVAFAAFQAIKQQLGNFRAYNISIQLSASSEQSGSPVWHAGSLCYGKTLSERRDISVKLDGRTGAVL